MSAIISSIKTNGLSLSTQNAIDVPISSSTSKISSHSKLYLGPGYTSLPGITNLFYAPYEFFNSMKAIRDAEQIHDYEGLFENGLRAASTHFNFINSLAQLAWYALKGGIFFKVISNTLKNPLLTLSIYTSVLGFIICFIEGVLAIHGLIRTKQFFLENYLPELESFKKILNISDPVRRRQTLSESLENFLQQPQLPIKVKNEIEPFLRAKNYSNEEFFNFSSNLLNQIEENVFLTKLHQLQQTYLQVSSEELNKIDTYVKNNYYKLSAAEQIEKKAIIVNANLKKKKNDLIRRVQPWLANEIEQTVPEMIQNLQSTDSVKRKGAKEKAAEIFDNIKIQSHKKFLIHSVSLAAVLMTIAGLILSCTAYPFFIPFIVLAIGFVLAITHYYLNQGLIDSKGWAFNIENCIPSRIKAIYKKITSKKEQKIELIPLTLHFNFITDKNPRRSAFGLRHNPRHRRSQTGQFIPNPCLTDTEPRFRSPFCTKSSYTQIVSKVGR
jgi:hypothetical protein